jgi:hypothetical protein
MTDAPDIPRIDWPAIRDMVRAPAYYARLGRDDMQRGEDIEARSLRIEQRRATSAGLAEHGDRHCPGCGRAQTDTSKCKPCRDKHQQYMETWRRTRRERRTAT